MTDSQDPGGFGTYVLPLILQINEGAPRTIGSCVVIAVAKRYALAFTARHVIDFMFDLADGDQLNELKIAPHFQKFRFGERFSDGSGHGIMTDALKLRALRMTDSAMAKIIGISYYPGKDLDIALLSLELEDQTTENFTVRCPMASQGAFIGDQVMLCGHPKDDIKFRSDDGKITTLEVTKSWKPGKVVGHLEWGEDYFVRSPGIIIDTGCPPGYSGGPVFIKSALLDSPVLVGIISSSDDFITKASLIWPALPLNHSINSDFSVPKTLLGLFEIRDAVTDVSNGICHITINPSATCLKDHVIWK